jgi:hypothetical protein
VVKTALVVEIVLIHHRGALDAGDATHVTGTLNRRPLIFSQIKEVKICNFIKIAKLSQMSTNASHIVQTGNVGHCFTLSKQSTNLFKK